MGEWRHSSMQSNPRHYGCEMMKSTPRLLCYLAIAPCSDGIGGYVVLSQCRRFGADIVAAVGNRTVDVQEL
jgi:hypothetical protein